MRTIIHLSDLHIGPGKEAKRARVAFRAIAASHPGVPVLITGDLTNSASKRQFQATRQLLNGLANTNPILAVPGNHDYAWKGIVAEFRPSAWQNWINYLGAPLGWGVPDVPWLEKGHTPAGVDGLGVWESGQIAFFGVDSGDPENKVRTSRGYISQTLATALAHELTARSDKIRIVFLHHHPFFVKSELKLVGSDRFLNAVKDNCELLLFGHKHDYGLWRNRSCNGGTIPLIVSSHKTTNKVLQGECLAFTVIEIPDLGTADGVISHRIEVIQL